MATLSIPWHDGPGNIVLTYTGQGNGQVTVTSDTDNLGHDRRQQITFVVQNGIIRHDVETASGNMIRTASGNTVRTMDNSMKVTVMVTQPATDKRLLVTAQNHIVMTANGNIVRLPNN